MANARSTWAELGALIGLSAPATADRVRKLEETGVITGYAALVNPEAIGCGLAALISLTIENPEYRPAIIKKIGELAEILECHHVAGDVDYILKVRCAGTRGLERLISDELKIFPGVKTKTTVILSTVKETPVLPLNII
jgi:Lrp/AsnC family transcriptional regulator, leucine-responsive regulatory protein